jgi:hypothetical protein
VFTAPLCSNELGADHRKHRSSIVAGVRFCGSVFTELLPSNELFRLAGVISQYKEEEVYNHLSILRMVCLSNSVEFITHLPGSSCSKVCHLKGADDT